MALSSSERPSDASPRGLQSWLQSNAVELDLAPNDLQATDAQQMCDMSPDSQALLLCRLQHQFPVHPQLRIIADRRMTPNGLDKALRSCHRLMVCRYRSGRSSSGSQVGRRSLLVAVSTALDAWTAAHPLDWRVRPPLQSYQIKLLPTNLSVPYGQKICQAIL